MLTATKRAERLTAIDREQAGIETAALEHGNGAFTPAQRERYDRLSQEYADLERQSNSDPLPRRAGPGTAGPLPQQSEQPQPRSRWINLSTGEEIDVARRGDRLAARHGAEADEVSLGRYVRGLVTGKWNGAEREKQLALGGSSVGGSSLVPEILADQWIDLARARSVMALAGVPFVTMTSDSIRIAKIQDGPDFAVKSENAAFSDTDIVCGSVNMHARTIGATIVMSREIAEDAPNAGEIVESALARGLATHMDRLALVGNGGSDSIAGVCVDTSVPSTGSIGAILWSDIHSAVVAVRAADFNPTSYIVHPTIAGDADLLQSGDGANSAAMWQGPPPSLNGVQRLETSAITTAYIAAGDFANCCLWGLRQGPLIEVSREAGEAFRRHQVLVKITWRGDFVVSQPNGLYVLSGITT